MSIKDKIITSIEVPATEDGFIQAQLFIKQRLEAEAVSKEIVFDAALVAEALFHNLLEQGIRSGTEVRITCRKSLGNIVIKIGYEGKIAYLFGEEGDRPSPENQILRAYEEMIDSSYRSGYNTFQITVKRKHLQSLLYCAVGALCAFLVFIPLYFLLTYKARLMLLAYYLMPIEQLFGNAAIMICAPVTFFSLLKNLTNTYIVSERYSAMRKLRLKALATSVIMILIAIGTSLPLFTHFLPLEMLSDQEPAEITAKTFSEIIPNIIPSSIFEPFESVSPVPLIIVALLVTYAFCSAGKYFTILKQAVDICCMVFSKMLGLVLFMLPLFFFVTVLQMLIMLDAVILWSMVKAALLILLSTFTLVLFYLLRLKMGGVRLRPFLRKMPPLLLENCRINSSIDAVPFNIRYCVRHYGMNRKRLERILPVFAQTMFDGNCFILMSIAMFLIFCTGDVNWQVVLVCALLVFFLSLGAPNQPGSVLIGTMILLEYVTAEQTGADLAHNMYLAIFFEVTFGIIQNLINVVGDIVMVAIEEHKLKTTS